MLGFTSLIADEYFDNSLERAEKEKKDNKIDELLNQINLSNYPIYQKQKDALLVGFWASRWYLCDVPKHDEHESKDKKSESFDILVRGVLDKLDIPENAINEFVRDMKNQTTERADYFNKFSNVFSLRSGMGDIFTCSARTYGIHISTLELTKKTIDEDYTSENIETLNSMINTCEKCLKNYESIIEESIGDFKIQMVLLNESLSNFIVFLRDILIEAKLGKVKNTPKLNLKLVELNGKLLNNFMNCLTYKQEVMVGF